MGIGTVLIGALPTYRMVGVWAPILLVLIGVVRARARPAPSGAAAS